MKQRNAVITAKAIGANGFIAAAGYNDPKEWPRSAADVSTQVVTGLVAGDTGEQARQALMVIAAAVIRQAMDDGVSDMLIDLDHEAYDIRQDGIPYFTMQIKDTHVSVGQRDKGLGSFHDPYTVRLKAAREAIEETARRQTGG